MRASFCASFEKFKVWEIDKRTSHDKINVGMQKICKESVNKETYENKIIYNTAEDKLKMKEALSYKTENSYFYQNLMTYKP